MMTPWKSSLRFRLILLVVLATLPALALTLYNGLLERRQATARLREDALRLTGLAAANTNSLFENSRQLLITLAQLPQIRGNDPAACNTLLADLKPQYTNYTTLTVIGADGLLQCSSIPFQPGLSAADRPYFQEVRRTKGFVVGQYSIGKTSGKAVLPFAYPILDSSGQVAKVVVATLDLGWLNGLVPAFQLPDQAALLLIDRNGTILSRYPDPRKWVGLSLPEAPVIRTIMAEQRQGSAEVPGVDGVLRLYAFIPLTHQGTGSEAFISLGIPTSVAYAAIAATMYRNLALLGLVALLALLVAYYGSEALILRQVRALVGASRRISAGDLDARSGIPPQGTELNQLGAAFDQMALALQEREQALTRAETSYRTLVEQVPAVTYRRALGADDAPLYVSPQIQALTGFTPEEWLDDSGRWRVQIHSEDRQRVLAEWEAARSAGQPFKSEYRLCTRDGQILWIGDEALLVRDNTGQPLFYQGLRRDITDLKLAEQTLKDYSAQLERSNRELQDFAYVASHDLQEPLRKIQAFGERLETKYAASVPDEARDYLERMRSSAARMQTLINDLLAYSRVTSRGQPFVPVNLNWTVKEVLSNLETRLADTQGRVTVDELPVIHADRLQMQQLFQNLIGNALKFHRPGVPPVVHISSRPVPTGGIGRGPAIQLIIQDNGIGFEEKYLDRIFQPFQRLHARNEFEGSGIGLAICRKIVDRHAGFITARSRPGEGTTFLIDLPIHPSGEAAKTASPEGEKNLAQEKARR